MGQKDYRIFEFIAHVPVKVRVAVHVPDDGENDVVGFGEALDAAEKFVRWSGDVDEEARYQMQSNGRTEWEASYIGPAAESAAFDEASFVIDLEGEEVE